MSLTHILGTHAKCALVCILRVLEDLYTNAIEVFCFPLLDWKIPSGWRCNSIRKKKKKSCLWLNFTCSSKIFSTDCSLHLDYSELLLNSITGRTGIFFSLWRHLLKQRNQLILTGIVDFKTGELYVNLCIENSVMLFRLKKKEKKKHLLCTTHLAKICLEDEGFLCPHTTLKQTNSTALNWPNFYLCHVCFHRSQSTLLKHLWDWTTTKRFGY